MKIFLVILGVLAALAVAAFISLQFFLGSIVKTGVNNFAPKLTQTKVVLAGASISPLSGSGTLTGLTVGNPAGWTSDKAFYLGKVHIDLKPFSILGDHIVINEIVIDQPEFVYETKIVASNIGDLMKNIEAATGSSASGAGKTAEPAKNGKPIKFEVKHFRLQNGKVTIGLGAAAIPLPMPPIELNDLGTKEGGITANQLAFAIMRSVTTGVVTATVQSAGQLGGTMGAAAGDAVKKTGETIKGFFGGKK
jgi:uncharacterized protein involved in outer membrane biogenesis